jgi:deoxyribose-phosphate aldolase
MREIVGRLLGVKAAGGIRTYEQACALIEAGATRIGTSAGVEIIAEAKG